VVDLVNLMGGFFGRGMKTASPPSKIMYSGLVSKMEYTVQTCSFKWWYSRLD
jgi:hypothetical protein